MFLGGQTNLKREKKNKKTRIRKHWDQREVNQACAKGGCSRRGPREASASPACGSVSLGRKNNDTITRNLYLHTRFLLHLYFLY